MYSFTLPSRGVNIGKYRVVSATLLHERNESKHYPAVFAAGTYIFWLLSL